MAKSWLAPDVARDLGRMGSALAVSRLPASLIARLQQRRLRGLIHHAATRSPFYRERYDRHGVTSTSIDAAQLEALPVVEKPDLIDHLDRVGTREDLRGERWQRLLEASKAGEPASTERFEVVHTSGTTSRELHVVYDRAAWTTARAVAMARVFRPPAFLHRPTRVAYYGGTRGRLGGVRFASASPPGLVDFLPLEVHAPYSDVAAAITRFSPDVLGGYPSAVEQLADAQQAGQLRLSPRRVVTSAEPLTPRARAAIRRAFGVEPTDFYASTESLILGASCAHARGIHLFSDWHVFELVDGEGHPVPPGMPGSLLVTNLYNRAMPLVRYRLGDELSLAPTPCSCGSPFPLAERIAGRSEDLLWLETNDGRMDFLHPVLMVDLGGEDIERVKVVQRNRRALTVQFVCHGNVAAATSTLHRQLAPHLRSKQMERSVRVDVVHVPAIRPDPRTGKFRFIEALPKSGERPARDDESSPRSDPCVVT